VCNPCGCDFFLTKRLCQNPENWDGWHVCFVCSFCFRLSTVITDVPSLPVDGLLPF
jgi:hypothetical protein